MRRLLQTSALCALLVSCGCTFSRSVVNPHHARHDTSWIVPGRTTRAEVVERFGLPPTGKDGSGVKEGSLRYLTADEKTGRLEIGYIITPTFEIARERHRHDILITFDDDGVVTLVSRTKNVNGKNRLLDFREAQR